MKRSRPARKTGPGALTGSPEAKKLAVVLLEVLSGARGPGDGSKAMGVSLNRYYHLETRALQGLITSLEPLPRGRRRRPEDEVAALTRDKQRLERELSRLQALVRAAQRSIGIAPASKVESKRKEGGRKKRRPTVRARKAIAMLKAAVEEPKAEAVSGAS